MFARRFFSVLVSILAIGVCVFISAISSDVEFTSLLINFGFLGIMLIAIIIAFFAGFRRITKARKALQRATEIIGATDSEEDLFSETDLFKNKCLNEAFGKYRDMVRRNPNGSCDVSDYINEDTLDSYIHRSLMDMIPDFLTSLGILGTFIGLVIGLRSFDPSGYEQMADSVAPLIDGIKVAFVTSIYGLALSLPFSLNLRGEYDDLLDQLDQFLSAYYLSIRPSHEVDAASKLLEQTRSQQDLANELTKTFADQLAKTYEQEITPAFDEMTQAVNKIADTFTQQQEEAVGQIVADIVDDLHRDLDNSIRDIQQSSRDLEQSQKNYMDFLKRSLTQMEQTFTDLQNHMQQTDRYNAQSISDLKKAQQDAFRIYEEQEETYQGYIRFMSDTLDQFSEIWELNSEKLQEYSDEIANMGPVQSNQQIRNDIAALSGQIADVRKHQSLSEELNVSMEPDETVQALEDIQKKLDKLEKQVSEPVLFRRKR